MKAKILISLFIAMTLIHSATARQGHAKIRHTVVFTLNHQKGSAEEKNFFAALDKLASIPGVENFKHMKQISRKNTYDYILTMDFSNQEAYDQYNRHPEHISFVQKIWLQEVKEFLEIDYEITE